MDDAGLVKFKLQTPVGDYVDALLLHVGADALLNVVGSGREIEPLEVVGTSGERAVDVDLGLGVRTLEMDFPERTTGIVSVAVAGIIAPRPPVRSPAVVAVTAIKAEANTLGGGGSRHDYQQRRDESGEKDCP